MGCKGYERWYKKYEMIKGYHVKNEKRKKKKP